MRHILIDTDAGVDDALAIALALASPDLAVEAITTVAGNIGVDLATRNVFTILEAMLPAVRPPVAKGASATLSRPLVTASHVHGDDGLGNITGLRMPDGSLKYQSPEYGLVDMAAPEFIVHEVKKHGGDLTLVTLGPLTNVAEAIRLDPQTMRELREIMIMGGAFRTYGNTSPVAEFNIFVDPEAAAAVVEFDVPKTIVPLDVTEKVILMRSELDRLFAAHPSPVMEFIREVSSFYMDFHRDHDGFDGCYMHDPTTMALAIDPSLAKTTPAEVHVEWKGEHTAGMTVADLRPERQQMYKPNAHVCTDIDSARCVEMFLSRIGR
jgi:inosine-uridine nucleoside N-ribohydrolase